MKCKQVTEIVWSCKMNSNAISTLNASQYNWSNAQQSIHSKTIL